MRRPWFLGLVPGTAGMQSLHRVLGLVAVALCACGGGSADNTSGKAPDLYELNLTVEGLSPGQFVMIANGIDRLRIQPPDNSNTSFQLPLGAKYDLSIAEQSAEVSCSIVGGGTGEISSSRIASATVRCTQKRFLSLFAGSVATQEPELDGLGLESRYREPEAIVAGQVRLEKGGKEKGGYADVIFVADSRAHTIRLLMDNEVRTIAGTPNTEGQSPATTEPGSSSYFNTPRNLAWVSATGEGSSGVLFILDAGNNSIRILKQAEANGWSTRLAYKPDRQMGRGLAARSGSNGHELFYADAPSGVVHTVVVPNETDKQVQVGVQVGIFEGKCSTRAIAPSNVTQDSITDFGIVSGNILLVMFRTRGTCRIQMGHTPLGLGSLGLGTDGTLTPHGSPWPAVQSVSVGVDGAYWITENNRVTRFDSGGKVLSCYSFSPGGALVRDGEPVCHQAVSGGVGALPGRVAETAAGILLVDRGLKLIRKLENKEFVPFSGQGNVQTGAVNNFRRILRGDSILVLPGPDDALLVTDFGPGGAELNVQRIGLNLTSTAAEELTAADVGNCAKSRYRNGFANSGGDLFAIGYSLPDAEVGHPAVVWSPEVLTLSGATFKSRCSEQSIFTAHEPTDGLSDPYADLMTANLRDIRDVSYLWRLHKEKNQLFMHRLAPLSMAIGPEHIFVASTVPVPVPAGLTCSCLGRAGSCESSGVGQVLLRVQRKGGKIDACAHISYGEDCRSSLIGGMVLVNNSRLLISDTGCHVVHDVPGAVRTCEKTDCLTGAIIGSAGQAGLSDQLPAQRVRFDRPVGMAADSSGGVYLADAGNGAIRRIVVPGNPASALRVNTVVTRGPYGIELGIAPGALAQPIAVAVHKQALYILDSGVILKLDLP